MLRLKKIRLTCFGLLLSLLIPVLPAPAAAQDETNIQIYLQQELLQWEQQPFILNGNTMVPMRALFEKLGFTVMWDGDKRAAIATRGDLNIILSIDKSTAVVNETIYYLEVGPVIHEESTFMPLRFVSESAGADVLWNEKDGSVAIQFNDDPQHKIRNLIENVTNSSSFIQNAIVITGGDGIKKNETVIKELAIANDGASAKVRFETGFTVSKAVKTASGVTISPAESAVYEFTCAIYKDGQGQWLLKQQPSAMQYALKDKKPFTD